MKTELLVIIIGMILDNIPKVNHNIWDTVLMYSHLIDKSLADLVLYVLYNCGVKEIIDNNPANNPMRVI